MSDWLAEKLKMILANKGYQKPEQYEDAIKMDSNENYAIPKQFQNDIILSAKKKTDIREYPLGNAKLLIDELAKFLHVKASMVGVGNGSDQILDLILSNFASKQTRILVSNPTFGFFEERTKLYGIPVTAIPFNKDMKLDADEFLKQSKNTDILYLDSPNNPTGFQFPKKQLVDIIKSFAGLVIIDEAYGSFSDYSLVGMTKTQKNLVITQTLSKSFGLAGLRLGYFVADAKFTEAFMNILQYPYPLSTLTIEAGILALKKSEIINGVTSGIKEERKRIIQTLQKYDTFDVFESKANFVLFDAHKSYKRIYLALAEQGIVIRNLGKVGDHEGCLRVSVGTREMNSKFLLAIRDLLQ